MGEAIGGLPETSALSGAQPASSRAGFLPEGGGAHAIGAYLAQQRALRGLSLEELVALTRIPRRSLERLEAGAFDRAPDGFTRGFVRTVALAIGLDPDETVARMLVEAAPERRARLLSLRVAAAVVALGALAAVLVLALSGPREAPVPAPAAAPAEATELHPHRHDAVGALARDSGAASAPSAAN